MQYKYAAAAEDESANARILPPTNLKTNDAVKTGAINANANIDMRRECPKFIAVPDIGQSPNIANINGTRKIERKQEAIERSNKFISEGRPNRRR
jgi:hypothetical protein